METMATLEEQIIDCWRVTDDIDILFEYIVDHPDCINIPVEHVDRIGNVLLGMKSLYELKFDRCFSTYEALVAKK